MDDRYISLQTLIFSLLRTPPVTLTLLHLTKELGILVMEQAVLGAFTRTSELNLVYLLRLYISNKHETNRAGHQQQ